MQEDQPQHSRTSGQYNNLMPNSSHTGQAPSNNYNNAAHSRDKMAHVMKGKSPIWEANLGVPPRGGVNRRAVTSITEDMRASTPGVRTVNQGLGSSSMGNKSKLNQGVRTPEPQATMTTTTFSEGGGATTPPEHSTPEKEDEAHKKNDPVNTGGHANTPASTTPTGTTIAPGTSPRAGTTTGGGGGRYTLTKRPDSMVKLMADSRTESVPSEMAAPLSVKHLPYLAKGVEQIRPPQPVVTGFDRMDSAVMKLVHRLPKDLPLEEKFDSIATWLDSYQIDVVPNRVLKQLKVILGTTQEEAEQGAHLRLTRRGPSSPMGPIKVDPAGRKSGAGALNPTRSVATCFALSQLMLILTRTRPILGPVVEQVQEQIFNLVYMEAPQSSAIGRTLIDVAVTKSDIKECLFPFRGRMFHQYAGDLIKQLNGVQKFVAAGDALRNTHKSVLHAFGRRVVRGSLVVMLRAWRKLCQDKRTGKLHKTQCETYEDEIVQLKSRIQDLEGKLAQKTEDFDNLSEKFIDTKDDLTIQLQAMKYDVIQLKKETAAHAGQRKVVLDALSDEKAAKIRSIEEWEEKYALLVKDIEDLTKSQESFRQDLRMYVAPPASYTHHVAPAWPKEILAQPHDLQSGKVGGRLPQKGMEYSYSNSIAPSEWGSGTSTATQPGAATVFNEDYLVDWAKAVIFQSRLSPWSTDKEVRRRQTDANFRAPLLGKIVSVQGGQTCLDHMAAICHVLFPKEFTFEFCKTRLIEVPPPEKAITLLKWMNTMGVTLPPSLWDEDLVSVGPEGTAAMTQLYTKMYSVCCCPYQELVVKGTNLQAPYGEVVQELQKQHSAWSCSTIAAAKIALDPESVLTNPGASHGMFQQLKESTRVIIPTMKFASFRQSPQPEEGEEAVPEGSDSSPTESPGQSPKGRAAVVTWAKDPTTQRPKGKKGGDLPEMESKEYHEVSSDEVVSMLGKVKTANTPYVQWAGASTEFGASAVLTALGAKNSRGTARLSQEENSDRAFFLLSFHHVSDIISRLEFDSVNALCTKHYLLLRRVFLHYSKVPSMSGATMSFNQFQLMLRESRFGLVDVIDSTGVNNLLANVVNAGAIPGSANVGSTSVASGTNLDVKKFLAALIAVAKLRFQPPAPTTTSKASDPGQASSAKTKTATPGSTAASATTTKTPAASATTKTTGYLPVSECFRQLLELFIKPYATYSDMPLFQSKTREDKAVLSVLEEHRNDLYKVFRGFCSEASPNRMEEERFAKLVRMVGLLRPAPDAAGGKGGGGVEHESSTGGVGGVEAPGIDGGKVRQGIHQGIKVGDDVYKLTERQCRLSYTLGKSSSGDAGINFDGFQTAMCSCALYSDPTPWNSNSKKILRFITECVLGPLTSKLNLSFNQVL